MSSAGHVMDMINRFNNNKQLKEERHNKFKKVKKVWQKVNVKFPEFVDRNKLSPAEQEKLKKRIRKEIVRNRIRGIILTSIFTSIVVALIIFYFVARHN